MAQPNTMRGSRLVISLGNGASPEVFAAPCGLTTKSFNLSAAVNEFNVPDCDNPDDPMWTERVISALSGTFSGSGVLDLGSYDEWRDWFLSGLPKNIRITLNELQAEGGGYYQMSAVLTGFNTVGNQGELATVDIEIQSNGEVTWVAAGT